MLSAGFATCLVELSNMYVGLGTPIGRDSSELEGSDLTSSETIVKPPWPSASVDNSLLDLHNRPFLGLFNFDMYQSRKSVDATGKIALKLIKLPILK